MKKTAAGFLLLLALAAELAFGQALVQDTKHNLSAAGPGTIKSAAVASGGTTEICVFCHTPHGSSNLAQLWNRKDTATYTLYASDYLTALAYPGTPTGFPTAPDQPKAKSKLCLSCHDGTIALGSVYNLPGSGGYSNPPGPGIPMAQSGVTIVGGKMPTTAAGFLGTSLTDDHPVGYLYRPTIDAELVTRGWPWNTAVKLDPDTIDGTLECHSCHTPHNNQFTKFLRMQVTDGSQTGVDYLCKHCHNKTNYDLSSHATSFQPYTPTVLVGTTVTADGPETCVSYPCTVREYACRSCHKPHTAPGKPLLRGAEQVTCYNSGCHGTNNVFIGNTTAASGTTWRNIQAEMDKARAHPTNTVSGLHKNLPFVAGTGAEVPADLTGVKRHAECPDCHNPHQVLPAQTVEKSTRGILRVSRALTGMWGVQPSWPAPPTGMGTNAVTFVDDASITYTVLGRSGTADLNPVTDEYQVCMKCHSNYVTLPIGARNLAKEINPLNSSYHGIVPFLADGVTRATTNYFVNSTTMVQPWGGTAIFVANAGSLTAPSVNSTEWLRQNPTPVPAAYANRGRVWCSDCHGSNASTMPPVAGTKAAPYGPHGSTLPIGTYVGTGNSDRMLVRTIASNSNGTPLCLGCHRPGSTQGGNTGSRFSRHGGASVGQAQGCFSCHMWDSADITPGAGDIFPHGMNKRWALRGGSTPSTGQMVDSFNGGWYTDINYTTKQCWTVTGTGATIAGSPCGTRGTGGNY